jgi:hypothetical protein
MRIILAAFESPEQIVLVLCGPALVACGLTPIETVIGESLNAAKLVL